MGGRRRFSTLLALVHAVLVAGGATALTLVLFLVLPLIQAINSPLSADTIVRTVDVASIPPPPPPPEPEPEKKPEPEKEEPKPELEEQPQPLDLEALSVALNGGSGDGWMSGDFTIKIDAAAAAGGDGDDLFSIADLDQKPRAIYQPNPVMDARMRRKAPGSVYVLFIVDRQGKVHNPVVQKSTDPVFERAALAAVKRWKFEPGKKGGKPVRFRMRVPFTFTES